MKKISSLVFLVLLVIVGTAIYFFFFHRSAMNPQPKGDDNNGTSTSVLSYRTVSQKNFSLLVPEEATTNVEASGRFKVLYLGPYNTMNSEISDGIVFYIGENEPPASGFTDVKNYAQKSLRDDVESGRALVSGLEEASVNGLPAYTYTILSELGPPIVKYVLLPQEDEGITINYTILTDPRGTTEQEYESIVAKMIDSFEFTSGSSTATSSGVEDFQSS